MFYDSSSVQGKCRMHCSQWHRPGLSPRGAYTRQGVVPGHQPPAWGASGHCLLFGSQSSQNSQTGSGPQANRVRWWDVRLCWLFIVLRVGYSSLGVDLHLLYVIWHSFIEVASPGNLCHSINPGNCPAVQLTSHSLTNKMYSGYI